jgi:lysophospholipase L1-like esterase
MLRPNLTARRIASLVFLVLSTITMVGYSWKIGVVLVVISIYICFLVYVLDNIPKTAINGPEYFQNWCPSQVTRRPVLLCLGDSITNGFVSANYTNEIPQKVADALNMEQQMNQDIATKVFQDPIWVINAGYNYVPTHVILEEKLNRMLSLHPDYILLLIGTNDILSIYKQSWRKEIAKINCIFDNVLTMSNLEHNIDKIISNIREASPKVEIGVCTIPPLGEDLNTSCNQLVRNANESIIKIVSQKDDEGISIIHVYQQMETVLLKKKKSTTTTTVSVDNYISLFAIISPIYHIFAATYVPIRWSFLSSIVGNELLTDGVHLNEHGRDIIVDLVVDWLQNRNIAKAIAVKSLR